MVLVRYWLFVYFVFVFKYSARHSIWILKRIFNNNLWETAGSLEEKRDVLA